MSGQFAHWYPVVSDALVAVSLVILANGFVQSALYSIQLFFGFRELRQRQPRQGENRLWWLLTSNVTVPISLIVPAHNEEETIVDSIRSILSLHYPHFEIVVINDGSTDGTLAALMEAFDLTEVLRYYDSSIEHEPIHALYGTSRHPNLLVVDKAQGGKADALNAGINLARSPVFCAVDADSVLEPDALLRAVQPFVDEPTNTVAVGGTIRITNGCEVRSGRILRIGLPGQIVPLMQIVEYLRAFLIGRLGWSNLKSLMLISGAFGIFSRRIVVEVGGYSTDTVGEDLELVIKIHKHMHDRKLDYAIRFVPDPVCWTEAPDTLRVLGRQRMRWQRGALETFFKHRSMLLNPRYGRAGIIGMGHVFLVDVLGPPLEVLGYLIIPAAYFMGVIDWHFFLAYLSVTAFYGVFISVGSLALEEMELRRFPRARDLVLLTLVAVAENFGYRQLNNFWRIGGWWQFLRKVQHWNEAPPQSADPQAHGTEEAELFDEVETDAGPPDAPEAAPESCEADLTIAPNVTVVSERCEADTVLVEGHLEGDVFARVLRIAPDGHMTGHAEVEFAEIDGHFEGSITASRKLTVGGSGRVYGVVRYGEVVIEGGGHVSGDIEGLLGPPATASSEAGQRWSGGARSRGKARRPKLSIVTGGKSGQ